MQDPLLGDVALLSEHLASTLLMIASETGTSSKQQSSLGRSPALGQSLVRPPAFLRCLHPLFLAQPLMAFGGGAVAYFPQLLQKDEAQQLQLGMAVQVSWQQTS